MFRNTAVAEPDAIPTISDETVALSVLSLDVTPPAVGWDVYLSDRGVEIVIDDVGRKSVSRSDARALLAEQREAESQKRAAAEAAERAAEAADKAWRASLPRGVSWIDMPPGIHPAAAMLAVDEDSRVSVREQLLQQELAHLANGADS